LANILPEAHFTVRSCGVIARQSEDIRDISAHSPPAIAAYDVMFL